VVRWLLQSPGFREKIEDLRHPDEVIDPISIPVLVFHIVKKNKQLNSASKTLAACFPF